ncbi:hypothetical protein KKD52_12230, partial [Myxococcota bacterium]|nr:hypothetical protein [Myxococcota bacterium]MBU1511121.1 hypothetical protein [Myxococcota bacterium]
MTLKWLITGLLVLFICACDDGGKNPVCGDGSLNTPGEACDGSDFEGGDACPSRYYPGDGRLLCTAACGLDESACEANGYCGDGILQADHETSGTCCADAGCPAGICDPEENVCRLPWELECATMDGTCGSELPWRCEAPAGVYDCGGCGCPGDEVCTHEVCYLPEVLSLARQQNLLPELPLDDYFLFLDFAASAGAMGYAEFLAHVRLQLTEDPRRVALLFGESHNSPDEQAIALQLLADLQSGEAPWDITGVGMENNGSPLVADEDLALVGLSSTGISGDLTNTSYCNAAVTATADLPTNDGGLYVQYMGSGHVTRETAPWDMHWKVVSFPHVAECLLRESRKSLTVLLFDPLVWLIQTDVAMLWQLNDQFTDRDFITAYLVEANDTWEGHVSSPGTNTDFDASFMGQALNVRFIPGLNPDVYFAYLPRPERTAWFLRSYQVLWSEPVIQDYFFTNGMVPGNCSISWDMTPGAERLSYWCTKDTLEFTATLNGITFEILEHSLQ